MLWDKVADLPATALTTVRFETSTDTDTDIDIDTVRLQATTRLLSIRRMAETHNIACQPEGAVKMLYTA